MSELKIRRMQDMESGKWKVYATDPDTGMAAWIWSSYTPAIPVCVPKFKPRRGLLGWLGFEKVTYERMPRVADEQAEYEWCLEKDTKKLYSILRPS